MAENRDISKLDWITILIYFALVGFGWVNIYATVYQPGEENSLLDFSNFYTKQLVWIGTSIVLMIAINIIEYRFYETFAYVLYGVVISALLYTLVLGAVVKGSQSWIDLGFVRIQPAEFAKFACAMALAKFLSSKSKVLENINDYVVVGAMIGFPAVLIILQGDTGSALVFATFILVLYREGLPGFFLVIGVLAIVLFILTLMFGAQYLIIGLSVISVILAGLLFFRKNRKLAYAVLFAGGVILNGFVFSVNYLVTEVLKPHQQNRIKVLLDPDADPTGAGYQVGQAKIAIGSGGLVGKGFLQGTQTKGEFVPDNHTDNIFCTIGEEYGFLGSLIFIVVFVALLFRIVTLAERQKSSFARIYGYGVASILFFHFAINVGMTIGLAPVVGIPLPFFSYGGSSLWSFTILLFIFLKLDAHKDEILMR